MNETLAAAPLARMLRSSRRAEHVTLSYVRSGPGGDADVGCRTQTGGRLADGTVWAQAAWAEILDRDPLIVHARRLGSTERVPTSPWRAGKASAWEYLYEAARDRVRGGAAKTRLDDLRRRGVEEPGEFEYDSIAEELGGDLTLDDLDPVSIEQAKVYAERAGRPWPPKPTSSGWQVQVWSL